MGADKILGPSGLFKIAGAGRVVREKPQELGEGFRKRKLGAVENVHRYTPARLTLAENLTLVAVCVNQSMLSMTGRICIASTLNHNAVGLDERKIIFSRDYMESTHTKPPFFKFFQYLPIISHAIINWSNRQL